MHHVSVTQTHTEMLYFKEDRACVNSTKRETYIYGLIVSCRRKDIVSPTNLCRLLHLSCQLLLRLRVKVLFSPHVSNQITLCHYLFLTFTFTVLFHYYYYFFFKMLDIHVDHVIHIIQILFPRSTPLFLSH